MNKAIRYALAMVPTPLPDSDASLEAWTREVLDLAGFPHNDTTANALCSMVMHLGPQVILKPKAYFIFSLRKAATNQACFNAMQAIRARNHEETLKRQAQVTAADVAQVEGF